MKNPQKRRRENSVCCLSDDFERILVADWAKQQRPSWPLLLAPEALKNALQIQLWVAELWESPKIFATSSIYLVRELYLQAVPVIYFNFRNGVLAEVSEDIDNLGSLEILDRELEQADRYLNHEMKVTR